MSIEGLVFNKIKLRLWMKKEEAIIEGNLLKENLQLVKMKHYNLYFFKNLVTGFFVDAAGLIQPYDKEYAKLLDGIVSFVE